MSSPLLIADDFGLGRGHDRVILDLIEEGCIDGTSVMVDGEIAPADLERLRHLRAGGARVGLHLNLTHRFPASPVCYRIGQLMRLCLIGRMPPDVRPEFSRQADRFAALFATPPDHYDGHQHCHCLPGLSALAAALPQGEERRMRVPLPASLSGLVLNMRAGGAKVAVIAALAFHARRLFRSKGWRVNADFSGFLKLDDPGAVDLWLPRLLAEAGDSCLLMVHPGDAGDPAGCEGHATASRAREAAILRRQHASATRASTAFSSFRP